MKAYAVFLSLFLHLAPVALLLFFTAKPELTVEPIAEAPIGDVFVTEQKAEATSTPSSNTDFPSEVKKPEQEADAPRGLPSGEAEPIGRIEPEYPSISRKLGEEGEAVFFLTIEAGGQVSAATLEKSSGSDRLDEAARRALLAAKFSAAGTKRMRVEFRLEK